LGGSPGDIRPALRRKRSGARLSPFESPQATEFDRRRIFPRLQLLGILNFFACSEADNQLGKLIGVTRSLP
jgi:hypothetical protein